MVLRRLKTTGLGLRRRFFAGMLLAGVLLGSALVAAPPAFAQANEPVEPTTAIETDTQASSDVDIDQRIEGIFQEFEGLSQVQVTVNSGVVRLSGVVNEAPLAVKAEALASRVKGVVAVENNIEEQTAVVERLGPVLGRFEKRLLQGVNYLPLFGLASLVGLAIALLGWLVSSREQPWSWLTPNAFIADLLRQLVLLAFIVLGIVVALDILGATAALGTILGAAGIFGLAIGFAVRDTVENYIASILLSIRQPFKPKDLVWIDSYEGRVIRLTSRATILMDLDGNHVRIPNATVFKSNIVNYSRNDERRFSFSLGVDADSVLVDALEICHQELMKLPFVLDDPEPAAWIEEVGDSNVVIGIAGWIDQSKTEYVKARSEAIRLVKDALERNGFALPEPIYRLRMDSAAASSEGPARPAPSAPRPAPSTVVPTESSRATSTDIDTAVIRKIDAERAVGEHDLLSEDAKDELGPEPR